MKKMVSSRKLRLESLEERALLAVTAGAVETVAELAAPTAASIWVVNTRDDPTEWSDTDNVVSLREAIGRASEGDTITFDSSLAGGTITLNGTQLEIIKGITIDASSVQGISIRTPTDMEEAIFEVTGGSSDIPVRLVSLTFAPGGYWHAVGNSGFLEMVNCSESFGYVTAVSNTGTLLMTDCTFDNNAMAPISNDGQMTMIRCSVSHNSSDSSFDYGCGIRNWESGSLTLTDCAIDGNVALRMNSGNCRGVGIYNDSYGTVIMTNCSVSGNNSYGFNQVGGCYGAGIYNEGTMVMNNCTVTENTTDHIMGYGSHGSNGFGGGIYSSGTLEMTNCKVTQNIAKGGDGNGNGDNFAGYGFGGGIYIRNGSLEMTNCTVAGNAATGGKGDSYCYDGAGSGGGIYSLGGTANLYNTIVAKNTASDSGNDIYRSSGSLYAYNSLSSYTDWTEASGCPEYVSSLPLFTDAAHGDYTLDENSQAIDRGNNEYIAGYDTDLAGNPRIYNNGIVDIGAYESPFSGGQTEKLAAPAITTGEKGIYVSYGANRHQIQWNAVDNASGYELAYSADGSTWMTVAAEETSAIITGLTYGTDMQYRVRALGTGSYTDSDWSAVKTFNVCPMDINNDLDISGGDRTLLAFSWLAEEGEDNYRYYADINGDGDIGGSDRVFLSNNWLGSTEDDDLVYPPAKCTDAVFDEFSSADLDTDLAVF